MRDLTRCGSTAAQRNPPKGLSFEIADHILARAWAASHGFQILVRLDHGAENEEYEEIIEFAGTGRLSRWIMWRDATSVFVQPILGKNQRSASVAEALEGLLPKQRVVLTDIAATTWPAN
jgi:hypothetical protein